MKVYEGAVLFVDMLGFSALTEGAIDISESDFTAHKFTLDGVSAQVFGAKLLAKFRRRLDIYLDMKLEGERLDIAQLSDCAFIWSKNVDLVAEVARKLMMTTLQSGLLCRSGMAYGQIIEPDLVNKKIGAFICGSAVTKAVKLEGTGKGARVFVCEQFESQLKHIPHKAFYKSIENSDGRKIIEFEWFNFSKLERSITPVGMFDFYNNSNYLEESAVSRIKLVKALGSAPVFNWNRSSNEGKKQIDNTIRVLNGDGR